MSGHDLTAQLLSDNAAAIRTLLIAGGVEAISDTVREDVAALLTGPAAGSPPPPPDGPAHPGGAVGAAAPAPPAARTDPV